MEPADGRVSTAASGTWTHPRRFGVDPLDQGQGDPVQRMRTVRNATR